MNETVELVFNGVLIAAAVGFGVSLLLLGIAKMGGKPARSAGILMAVSMLLYLGGGIAGAAVRVESGTVADEGVAQNEAPDEAEKPKKPNKDDREDEAEPTAVDEAASAGDEPAEVGEPDHKRIPGEPFGDAKAEETKDPENAEEPPPPPPEVKEAEPPPPPPPPEPKKKTPKKKQKKSKKQKKKKAKPEKSDPDPASADPEPPPPAPEPEAKKDPPPAPEPEKTKEEKPDELKKPALMEDIPPKKEPKTKLPPPAPDPE